ncbi:hypothetical protein [Bordetella sp. BOR01]|uniref:hypothetical protein n=1 Tax=Bordetella sp. BOR01 TaxID=2854779 RepID=UPI001C447AEA|nr:hypothetical protein [Bordetella sp. BOR01]MBV7486288.1 hypothetical protein [Bordetella sp. BOR01]
MNPDTYVLHDLTHFPMIMTRRPTVQRGAVQTWAREMDMLLADSPVPFVLVASDLNVDMAAVDRRDMVAWQALNMARLRRRCAGFISIVPDPRAFGLPFMVVPTLAQARDHARELLAAFAGGQGGVAVRREAGHLLEV